MYHVSNGLKKNGVKVILSALILFYKDSRMILKVGSGSGLWIQARTGW